MTREWDKLPWVVERNGRKDKRGRGKGGRKGKYKPKSGLFM